MRKNEFARPWETVNTAVVKGILARPGAVFAVIFLWRLALLVFAALPVPSNDAFFYDGPVVNLLLHGRYANPALGPALPISGAEMFCAYPPIYQAVLLGWMALFGVSAVSAMTLHLLLFGGYMLILLAIFRRLRVPGWAAAVGGVFLFVITFDDRPDSLAHVFGIAAVYAWVRSGRAGAGRAPWTWAMAGCAILGLATSVQLGALYCLLLWMGVLAQSVQGRGKLPLAPMAAMAAVPAGLAGLVALGFPHVWAGFMEHARQTPSLTGWRWPLPDEILKTVRNAPGVLAAAALLIWLGRSGVRSGETGTAGGTPVSAAAPPAGEADAAGDMRAIGLVTAAATLAALGIVAGGLFLLSPNSVLFVGPLQPLIVGGCLALLAAQPSGRPWLRAQVWLFVGLAAVGSIRAVGMTTWGVACAADAGYPSALRRVRSELNGCAPGNTVVLSSAYLYEAARHQELRWIHSDWMEPARRHRPSADWEGLLALKPARLILTQFDYYRRYLPLLAQLKTQPGLAQVQIVNTANLPAPDSIRPLQKVLQHISWAPVVVTVSWKSALEPFLICVDEIDEAPNVVPMGQAGLFFAFLETGLHLGIVRFGVVQHALPMGGFDRLGFLDVLEHPVADLAVGNRVADDLDELAGVHPCRLEPQSVETFAEVGLVIRKELARQVKAGFIDEPRQMHPPAHHLARASRINDFAHAPRMAGGARSVNESSIDTGQRSSA